MTLTPGQIIHINLLILRGKNEEAVQYLQQTMNISREEALKLLVESRKVHNPPATEQERATTARNGRKVIIIITIIGVILFSVTAYLIVDDYQFSKHAVSVQGEVIEYYEYETYSEEDGSSKSYSPVFRYEINGQTHTTRGRGSDSPGYALGEKINILADQTNPERVLPDTFRDRWFLPVMLGISSLAFLGFAYLMIRFGKNP
jgi:hypothetical protein